MLLLFYLLIFGRERSSVAITFFLVLLEVVLVNTSIAMNGAASNPFSSILLVPLVLGLMLLPFKAGFVVLVVSIIGQGLQLVFPAPHQHGEMMQNHAQGMILSFILTSLLVTTVIYYLRLQISAKTAAIQQLRERQLRDEQLLAIGTAAAQLTHDAATPVQTMRLILEEIQTTPDATLLAELEGQFSQLEQLLRNWRDIADDVREARLSTFTPGELLRSIKHLIHLARPEANVIWPASTSSEGEIYADRTLIPALANIVINACDAADSGEVRLQLEVSKKQCNLTVSNPTGAEHAFPKDLLGSRFIESQNGFGVGAVLSNATIEKCGGSIRWEAINGSITTCVKLPLDTSEATRSDN